jgi:hypothetical protein
VIQSLMHKVAYSYFSAGVNTVTASSSHPRTDLHFDTQSAERGGLTSAGLSSGLPFLEIMGRIILGSLCILPLVEV